MKQLFSYLAIATILALGAMALFLPSEPRVEDSAVNVLLLPDLAARVDQVQRVEIVTAGDKVVVTLNKSPDEWQLEQLAGYRADWPKLQALLAGLAQAKIVEVKTDKRKYYPRLGVEDVAATDASGVLVRIGNPQQTTDILIGKQAQGRPGQYVRVQESASSVLLDRALNVPRGVLDWVDRRIVDINSSEVAEVEIIHPDGDRVFVTRISADQTDFDLVELPSEREVLSSWAVNSLGSALTLLDLESVRPAEGVDWSNAVRMRLLTFSGLEIMADMIESGDDYLVRLQASHPAAAVIKAEDEDSGQGATAQQADEAVSARVVDINRKVGGWAYGIAKYKYDTMVKSLESVLKPLESS